MACEWKLLGNVFFRKVKMSSMDWNLDLSKCLVAAASYGGPIALMKKFNQSNRFVIKICSSSGSVIGTIQWNSGKILKMGWSNREELLCLQDDGKVLIYDIFGEYMTHFSMGKDANDVKIIDGQIFTTSSGSTGIAVLTSTHRFYLVSNIYDPKLKQLPDLPDWEAVPTSWCVVNTSSPPQLLVAKGSDVYTIDLTGISSKQKIIKTNQVIFYTEMSVSFDNKFLALFTSLGVLWIGSSDLKETYCEYNTRHLSRPNQLLWCGKSAVVARWDNQILLIGPEKNEVEFEFDTPIYLVPEKDGVRIVGANDMEILQKVPKDLENVFKIGAITPEAMLLEASRLYQESRKETYEYIKIIKDDLPKAYMSCVKAAGFEFDQENQKELLKAAEFGKDFFNGESNLMNMSHTMSQKIRILNALRSTNVGMALTIVQLEHLTFEVLIERLLMRKLFWLAYKICDYLKFTGEDGTHKVLSRWACDKIKNSKEDDDHLGRMISMKLSESKGVSYTEIINKAIECKHIKLALDLINCEPSVMKQIPLLLKLDRKSEALSKAIESGDTDLVALVLMHWKDELRLGEFLRNISQFPAASAFYIKQCKEKSLEMSIDVHYQSDNHLGEALCKVAMGYEQNQKTEQRLSNFLGAQEAFQKAKKETYAKLTEVQIKLTKYQVRFEDELDRPFIDLSLNDTLRDLLVHENFKHFEQLRKEFKLTDKRIWSLKIQTLAETGNWAELNKFSKSKKSPIGYEPFVDACIKHNNLPEAKNYISQVSVDKLVKYYLKIGLEDEAANAALHSKNEDDIELVLSKCSSNRSIVNKIQSQLKRK